MLQARIEDGNSNSGSESRSRSLLDQPTAEKTAYLTNEERINSFENYPVPSPINFIRLAKAGFYYEPTDVNNYRVVCVGCSNVVNSWNTNDVPTNGIFHMRGCKFADDANGSQGRSATSHVKASVPVEESTSPKPLAVGRNATHSSLQNPYGHQRTNEEFSRSVQHIPGQGDVHGRPPAASMPTVVTRQRRMHSYHDPRTGQEEQTYEEVESTSGHGRNERGRESPMDIYAANEPRTSGFLANPPSIGQFYPTEDETFQSQSTTIDPRFTSRLENSQDLETFLNGLDMKNGDNRLHTFQELWDHDTFKNIRLLVMCGFYCIGQGDAVQCFQCGVVIANWTRNDNPRTRHEEMSPDCLFLHHPEETGEEPLSLQRRTPRLRTPSQSMSSSYAPSSAYPRSPEQSLHSYPRRPSHHQEYSREASLSPRRDLHPQNSYYSQGSYRGSTAYSPQHSVVSHPVQASVSPNRGQTSLYHGSSYSRQSSNSSQSRNSSISPQRTISHIPQSRGGRSPGPHLSHHSRHSSRSPAPRHQSLIAQPSIEGLSSNVIPEEYQPAVGNMPQPPAPAPAPAPAPPPQQRNDPMIMYPCLSPRTPELRDAGVREGTYRPPFPRYSRLRISYRDMAEAGFYYTGQQDRVKCWYCGGGLGNFDANDNIWTEHAKHYPHCEYLLQRRGQQFVNDVTTGHPMQRSVPVEQLPTVESNSGPLPPPPVYTQQQLRQHREDLYYQGMTSEPTRRVQEMGYSENLIAQVQWRNVQQHGVCYQTTEALLNALIDATDAENGPRTYADRRQESREQPVQAVQAEVMQQQQQATAQRTTTTTTTTSSNRQRRQHTGMTKNRIVIDGVPMEEFMANIFDTPFFRGEYNNLLENTSSTTVVQGNAPNIRVRRSRVVNNTRRQPPAEPPRAPAAVSTVPPPMPPPLRALEIPGTPRSNNTGSRNNTTANGANVPNESASTSEGTDSNQERLERLEREKRCKICLSNDADILFSPCSHICSCSVCSERTATCPVCRAHITNKIRTYRS